MFSSHFALKLCLIYAFPTAWTQQLCFFQEKSLAPSGYKIFHCDAKYERCCGDGCCPIKDSLELQLQVGSSGGLQPFIWFLVALILMGYIYITIYYTIKKCRKGSDRISTTSVNISRSNTQPHEVSLMLSFNQHREGLERFHFEHVGSTHLSVPLTPLTPVTPPPAYVTLTPPPNYNVAIHFPPVYRGKEEKIEEEAPVGVKN